MLHADGLRITLLRWIRVGKVVGLVLMKCGKLPRPCGLTLPDVLMKFESSRMIPAPTLNADRLKPNRANRPVEALAKLADRDGLHLSRL